MLASKDLVKCVNMHAELVGLVRVGHESLEMLIDIFEQLPASEGDKMTLHDLREITRSMHAALVKAEAIG